MRVALVGLDDARFEAELGERTGDVTHGEPGPDTDLVFMAADDAATLAILPALRSRLRPNGAIWVVSHKGKAATLRDIEVMAAGKASGLVDNKVVSFDDARTSIRLVIPVALRPKA
jgi:predicted O-methyltransferase YrrM